VADDLLSSRAEVWWKCVDNTLRELMMPRLMTMLALSLSLGCDPVEEADLDGDGYTFDDCDDRDASVHPDAVEVCDGQDNNCTGKIDNGLEVSTWYADEDGDGYGEESTAQEACAAPADHVAQAGDCDDSYNLAFPGAGEICDGPTRSGSIISKFL
jgi:hypothetical protein